MIGAKEIEAAEAENATALVAPLPLDENNAEETKTAAGRITWGKEKASPSYYVIESVLYRRVRFKKILYFIRWHGKKKN